MREELQKFSSNNNAMDNKALHSIRSCTHWSHLKELSTLIKFLITSLALTDLLVEVVLTFSIVRMKRARGLDWSWIPLSSLSLKLTCLVSKLAEYWSGEGRASMGVGCTWEISVPSAQFCFEPETEVKGKFSQSCQTLCNPMDCSPPGSSVHGILQARILVWIAFLFSRGSSQPRDQTQVSCIAGRFFTIWATRESPRILE